MFPTSKPVPQGNIYAADLAVTYDAVAKVNSIGVSGMTGVNSGRGLAVGRPMTTGPQLVEVISQVTDDAGKAVPGLYLCSTRYYTPDDAYPGRGAWATRTELTYALDATDLLPKEFAVHDEAAGMTGSVVSAWWDKVRSAYVPTSEADALRPIELEEDLVSRQLDYLYADAGLDVVLGHFLDDQNDYETTEFYPLADQTRQAASPIDGSG